MNQNDAILAWLQAGHKLTQLEALERFNCMRLPSRVDELHKKGVAIVKTMVKLSSGKYVAEYSLP